MDPAEFFPAESSALVLGNDRLPLPWIAALLRHIWIPESIRARNLRMPQFRNEERGSLGAYSELRLWRVELRLVLAWHPVAMVSLQKERHHAGIEFSAEPLIE